MKIKLISCAALLAAAAMSMTACSGGTSKRANEAAYAEVSIQEVVAIADPKGAADAIYATLETSLVEELNSKELEDYMNISSEQVISFVAYRSDPKKGLCDMAIIKPEEDTRDEIRESLYQYKELRMEEFRNYDILDAYSISQNALVLEQGDYVILLMLPDNEEALELLDEYIPQ